MRRFIASDGFAVLVALLVSVPLGLLANAWEHKHAPKRVTITTGIGGQIISRVTTTNPWVEYWVVDDFTKTGKVSRGFWRTNQIK